MKLTRDDALNLPGFCGCGVSELAYTMLRDVLAAIDSTDDGTYEYAKERWDRRSAALEELIGKEDGAVFWWFMYFLDQRGLTEHGGGVGACWLTDKGKFLLAYLREHGCDTDEWPNGDDCAAHG